VRRRSEGGARKSMQQSSHFSRRPFRAFLARREHQWAELLELLAKEMHNEHSTEDGLTLATPIPLHMAAAEFDLFRTPRAPTGTPSHQPNFTAASTIS
jgi:hypothetical protein